MSRSTGNHIKTPIITPVACLDLHGYRKEAAIRALTDFIERLSLNRPTCDGSVWVNVITGSGQHSSQGPVLRTAVDKLLRKRQMKFILNADKGGFLVDASSGIVLYASGPPTDTKVVVRSMTLSENNNIPLVGRVPPKILVNPPAEDNQPLPVHVAQDDALLEQAKEVSRKQRHTEATLDVKERQALKKAMSDSMLEHLTLQKNQEREDDSLQTALIMSVPSVDNEDEQILQKALLESKLMFEMSKNDVELEAALKMSESHFHICDSEIDALDSELQEILRQSAEEFSTVQPMPEALMKSPRPHELPSPISEEHGMTGKIALEKFRMI